MKSPSNFQVKEIKIIEIGPKTTKFKMLKLSCLKWTYGLPGIDNRVASFFKRNLTAIVMIPESLKLIGQFYYAKINKKDITVSYGRTYGQTDPKCRKTSFLKTDVLYYSIRAAFLLLSLGSKPSAIVYKYV